MNRAQRRQAARSTPSRPPTVVIGHIHPGQVSAAFDMSVSRARDFMVTQFGMLPGRLERRARSQNVYAARNDLTEAFLESSADYLLMVDADMGFGEDALPRLLASADPAVRPIVGGLCFAQRGTGYEPDTFAERFDMVPTVQVFEVDDAGQVRHFKIATDYPRDMLCQVDATGAAFLLVHRTVFEKLAAEHGPVWFTPIWNRERNRFFGEDTSFFIRCYQQQIPVHLDTRVKTSHDKGGVFLTEAEYDRQRAC